MTMTRCSTSDLSSRPQRGMALLVSLVFLLLLTLLGISSMQNATLQERMAGSVMLRNQTFQTAEAALRMGENAVAASAYSIPVCDIALTSVKCSPPAESATLTSSGTHATSGVTWIAADRGFYGIQKIGTTLDPVNMVSGSTVLYRITGVAIQGKGNLRTVLESIYAKADPASGDAPPTFTAQPVIHRRIMWRQIQ
jgi:type IV pilus assembly protein PilX